MVEYLLFLFRSSFWGDIQDGEIFYFLRVFSIFRPFSIPHENVPQTKEETRLGIARLDATAPFHFELAEASC